LAAAGSRWHSPAAAGADRGGDFVGLGVFEQVPGRAGFERGADFGFFEEAGDGDYLDDRQVQARATWQGRPRVTASLQLEAPLNSQVTAAPRGPAACATRSAVQRSQATRAEVAVHAGSDLALLVRDNGSGIKDTSRRSGLANLARRAGHMAAHSPSAQPKASNGTALAGPTVPSQADLPPGPADRPPDCQLSVRLQARPTAPTGEEQNNLYGAT